MVNDARWFDARWFDKEPIVVRQTIPEWIAEHCRFNIGELDNLEWEPSHNQQCDHVVWTLGAMYFSKGELVVRCSNQAMMQCTSVCPRQSDTIAYYLDNGSVRAILD